MLNDEITTDAQLTTMIDRGYNKQGASDTQVDLCKCAIHTLLIQSVHLSVSVAVLGGVITEDIKCAYPIENLRNMGPTYFSRLRTINQDSFNAYRDAKQAYRKFKTQTRRNQRALIEASDMLNAWQALAECGPKTATHIN